jgi:hypothetical protein
VLSEASLRRVAGLPLARPRVPFATPAFWRPLARAALPGARQQRRDLLLLLRLGCPATRRRAAGVVAELAWQARRHCPRCRTRVAWLCLALEASPAALDALCRAFVRELRRALRRGDERGCEGK